MNARPPIGPYYKLLASKLGRKWHMVKPATYLLQEELPVDAHSRLLVLPAVFSQPARDVAHPLEAVATVQQVVDVLGHDLGHVFQLIVQLVQILRRSRVLVRLLCALDESVELDKGVRPEPLVEVLVWLVGLGELGGEVGEVCEGQFARVGAVADAEEAQVAVQEVAGGHVSDGASGAAGAMRRGAHTDMCRSHSLCWLAVPSCGSGGAARA
jgi:hypothetical protein